MQMALSYHELILLLNKATEKERKLELIIDKQKEILTKKEIKQKILSKL
jgi:hypothetical protein